MVEVAVYLHVSREREETEHHADGEERENDDVLPFEYVEEVGRVQNDDSRKLAGDREIARGGRAAADAAITEADGGDRRRVEDVAAVDDDASLQFSGDRPR